MWSGCSHSLEGVQVPKRYVHCAQRVLFFFLGPVPSMCWQSPDSLSYHVGMGTVDRGFFKVAAGSGHLGVPKESDSPRERPTCKGDRFFFLAFSTTKKP